MAQQAFDPELIIKHNRESLKLQGHTVELECVENLISQYIKLGSREVVPVKEKRMLSIGFVGSLVLSMIAVIASVIVPSLMLGVFSSVVASVMLYLGISLYFRAPACECCGKFEAVLWDQDPGMSYENACSLCLTKELHILETGDAPAHMLSRATHRLEKFISSRKDQAIDAYYYKRQPKAVVTHHK